MSTGDWLSKIAAGQVFSRRLQVQEQLTSQIADTILENKRSVAVVMEGTICACRAGSEKQNSFAVTSAMHGIFGTRRGRMEFLAPIRLRKALWRRLGSAGLRRRIKSRPQPLVLL